MQEYKIPVRLGIDDINYYPGQESEWWTEEQWKAYRDDLPARKERDRLYVEQLRMEGRYGKVEEYTIRFEHNPAFDTPSATNPIKLSSYRFIVIS